MYCTLKFKRSRTFASFLLLLKLKLVLIIASRSSHHLPQVSSGPGHFFRRHLFMVSLDSSKPEEENSVFEFTFLYKMAAEPHLNKFAFLFIPSFP